MPEIPGNPPLSGTHPSGGRHPTAPGGLGLSGTGNAGGAGKASGSEDLTGASRGKTTPRYFGFHTDASIMARLAGMGLSPTLGNLRIAQQLLRYGEGLDPERINEVSQIWSQIGEGDTTKLEAIVALMSKGLAVNAGNMQAMGQLLSGGPLSHLLARLTMAVKGESNPQLAGIGQKLNSIWQLGHLDKNLLGQLKDFQKLLGGLREDFTRVDSKRLSPDTATELGRLGDLLEAHRLLTPPGANNFYLPFFIWRQHQPLPAEIFIQEEGGGSENTQPFTRITLAVETLSQGRMVVDMTSMREHLSVRFDVQDDKIKKRLDPRLAGLRSRLSQRNYQVDILACQALGASRSISTLLPKRRDIKRLSRVQGVL
ncbi:MAG: hypothetical protein VKN33_00840 [Candidatus Sericytochromatia bacterium]|nr:hypothetical protein [Candidatus Sericytochromatia bacterium]